VSIADWVLTTLSVAAATTIVMLAIRNRGLAKGTILAERRFDLLQHLVPSLTDAVTDSTAATCARILDRLGVLVPTRTALCFYIEDGRLILGARSGDTSFRLLREGATYEGHSIVDIVRDTKTAIAVGPSRLEIPSDVDVVDASTQPWSDKAVPVAGSRDRVYALAVPLVRSRGRGLSPEVIGVLYLERIFDAPFDVDDLRSILTVSRLASDALERARFADVVRRDSTVDGLTGLMTPIAFRKRLRDEIGAKRDVGLFFVDTDRFKLYNDTFGHAAGDRLLRALAALFGDIADKSGGFAGRNGGDEFCIALLDRTKDAAVEIAERVRANVDATGFGEAVQITVSIGVAHFPVDIPSDDRQPADRLLEVADGLMYEAKRSGRNRVEFLRFRAQPHIVMHPGEGPIPRR
jgi:diguanylate cyclase (GGDEF)-like protein